VWHTHLMVWVCVSDFERGCLHCGVRLWLWVSVLCVAVCCSVLQCVAVCCSVLQCLAVSCSVLQCVAQCVERECLHCGLCLYACFHRVLQCLAVSCSVSQCCARC